MQQILYGALLWVFVAFFLLGLAFKHAESGTWRIHTIQGVCALGVLMLFAVVPLLSFSIIVWTLARTIN